MAMDAEDMAAEEGTPIYDLAHHRFGVDSEVQVSLYLFGFLALLGASFVVQYLVTHRWRWRYLPSAAAVLGLGAAVSGVILLSDPQRKNDATSYILAFEPTTFFVGFLPPIIFNSGYQMNSRYFFAHFASVCALAVVGTMSSAVIVAVILWIVQAVFMTETYEFAELLTFGALISATDPVSVLAVFVDLRVDPTLFYLVFGESVINDAVGIVLFHTFAKFVGFAHGWTTVVIAIADFFVIFGMSMFMGFVTGAAGAYAFKRIRFQGEKALEIATFVVMIFVPFLLSEALEMSGIVTTLFCGMTMREYAHGNLDPDSRTDAAFITSLLAHMSETAVFLNLGLSVFGIGYLGHYKAPLIAGGLVACLVARACHVYPLARLLNKREGSGPGTVTHIPKNTQHMVWFSGLRGAVAYVCALIFPNENGHREDFIVTTMVIVLVTVFVMGGLTDPMLRYLGIPTGVSANSLDLPPATGARARALARFEEKWIAPCLQAPPGAHADKAAANHSAAGEAGDGAAAGGGGGDGALELTDVALGDDLEAEDDHEGAGLIGGAETANESGGRELYPAASPGRRR